MKLELLILLAVISQVKDIRWMSVKSYKVAVP